jgi:hypothetical protein
MLLLLSTDCLRGVRLRALISLALVLPPPLALLLLLLLYCCLLLWLLDVLTQKLPGQLLQVLTVARGIAESWVCHRIKTQFCWVVQAQSIEVFGQAMPKQQLPIRQLLQLLQHGWQGRC